MSETRLLARFAAETSAASVPGYVLDAARMSLADAVAVMLAASGIGEGCAAFAEVARVSGSGPCVVIGHGFTTSAPMAAFANGAMAHAMDFEDTHDHAIAHPHAAAIAAVLAVADTLDNVSGEEVLAAIAIAGDLVCRIAGAFEVNPDNFGWHTTPWLGVFGAATAAGRLLNLNPEQMTDAWSLAMSQMGSFGELKNSPATHIRAVRDAFAAQAGVLGAMLAARGVKGYGEPLQGSAGFFAAVVRGEYVAARLIGNHGERWMGSEVSFKPWPCCRGTHAYVDAALRLASRLQIDPFHIDKIDVVINEKNRMLCEPRALKIRPDTAISAKFSIPFTTATALLRGTVSIDTFDAESLQDSTVLGLAAKVHYIVDESIPLRDVTRGSVTLHMAAGSETEHVIHARGHPLCPLTREQLREKFDDCVKHSGIGLNKKKKSEIWFALEKFKVCNDARQLTSLLQASCK